MDFTGLHDESQNESQNDGRSYYFIRSNANNLVLEVDNGNREPGTVVIPKERTGGAEQQWRDDPATGTIRSKLDGSCLDIEKGQLVINPHEATNRKQQWKRHDDMLVNRFNKMVLQLNGLATGAPVIETRVALGNADQSWSFELL